MSNTWGPDDFWPSYYRSKSERGGKSENVTEIMRRLKQARKLQDAQAEKLTNLQANKLTK